MKLFIGHERKIVQLMHYQEERPKVTRLLQKAHDGNQDLEGYGVHHGCVALNGRVHVPKGELRDLLLREFHNSIFGVHSGILRTFKRISQLFTWPELKKDVVKFVRACDTCQRNKSDNRSPAGLLVPLSIPD